MRKKNILIELPRSKGKEGEGEMREILFRGKCLGRLHMKGFVFGSLGVIDTDLVAIYQCKEFTEDVKFLVDLGTVGQYTNM